MKEKEREGGKGGQDGREGRIGGPGKKINKNNGRYVLKNDQQWK